MMKRILKPLTIKVNLPIVGLVLLIIFTSLVTISITQNNPELFGLLKGPSIIQMEEEELVRKVRKLIELPEDEKPTVATVTDKEELGDQVFFNKAKEGDKVLIYTNARKVVLYRPSENRVVEVGNVNIENQEEVAGLEDIQVSNRFVILNGTNTSGLTREIEQELKEAMPDAEVIKRANAETAYEESILVDINGSRESEAEELAGKLGMRTSLLPGTETKPEDVDFLIIVGEDRAPKEEEIQE
jgi:hypothetical protein